MTTAIAGAAMLWTAGPVAADTAKASNAGRVPVAAPATAEQYHDGWNLDRMGATVAHQHGYDGLGQTIAIVDYGIDVTHPDLIGRVVEEACFHADGSCPNQSDSQFGPGSSVACTTHAECAHDTAVAGVAAGLHGVAPKATVIAADVFQPAGDGSQSTVSDQIRALRWIYGLRTKYSIAAVNLSLGFSSFIRNCDDNTEPQYRLADYRAAVADLRAAGIAVVAASGNDGYVDGTNAPACLSNVVSVGNTGQDSDGRDQVFSQSNSADFLTLLAPGTNCTSAAPGGGRELTSGTSIAAPHVAGAFALLKQHRPAVTVAESQAALVETGTPVTDDRNGLTKPRIDVWRALTALGAGR